MKHILLYSLLLCLPMISSAQNEEIEREKRIQSRVDSSNVENVVLEQIFIVNVPIDSVWNALTTGDGWEAWATAQAEVDLKINGTIRTHYSKEGKLGDTASVTLHIINFVPQRMITLQAEITNNFPEFMKEDEKEFFNTIILEEISPGKTRVTSFGMGYKLNDKYRSLMKFFVKGNEDSYLNMINYLESGEPTLKY